jgi:hypothetical protein
VICRNEREQGRSLFTPEFREIVRLPGPEIVKAIEARLDSIEGSLQPADDMTVVLIERLRN